MAITAPALLVTLLLAGPTVRGAAPPKAEGRALRLFEESARVYREGRFQEAVDLLLEARTLTREPVLLYNLARAYEALGKLPEAADAYTRYLEEETQAPDRGAIEGRIATMRRTIEEREALRRAQEQPPAAVARPAPRAVPLDVPPPPPPARSESISAIPWVVAGIGVTTLGAGVAFGVVARAREDDARQEPVQQAASEEHDQATRYATIANVAFGVGTVLALAGSVWLLVRAVDGPGSPRTAALTPRGFVGPGGFLLGASF